MAQQGGKQPSSGGQPQQGKPDQSKANKDKGPDNPSKHSINDPANKEPHRESGSGRHEPSP